MAMEWTCGFCDRTQISSINSEDKLNHRLSIGSTKFGYVGFRAFGRACLNPKCREVSFSVEFTSGEPGANGTLAAKQVLNTWQLLPESLAKPQPDYIPKPLRDDYFEACLIRDKSPKASATLARRCLQGMVRDFCKISKARLVDEISELRRRLDAGTAPQGVSIESVEAIDKVRSIGNIGAHMEKDINIIVDVDEDEAQLLVELIEMLFAEWYVAKHKREERLRRLSETAAAKQEARRGVGEPMRALPAPSSD